MFFLCRRLIVIRTVQSTNIVMANKMSLLVIGQASVGTHETSAVVSV